MDGQGAVRGCRCGRAKARRGAPRAGSLVCMGDAADIADAMEAPMCLATRMLFIVHAWVNDMMCADHRSKRRAKCQFRLSSKLERRSRSEGALKKPFHLCRPSHVVGNVYTGHVIAGYRLAGRCSFLLFGDSILEIRWPSFARAWATTSPVLGYNESSHHVNRIFAHRRALAGVS